VKTQEKNTQLLGILERQQMFLSYMTPRCMHGYDWQYFGGTNFARTSGGPFITTSYDYDAPIDEYGVYLSSAS
jgi:hypothetical protein